MITKTLSFLILLIFFLSCGKSKTKESSKSNNNEPELGVYVYIDRADVLHTRTGCKAVFKDRSMQVVRPCPIEDVVSGNLDRICSQCVTEDQLCILMGYLAAKEKSYSDDVADSMVVDYESDYEDTDDDY